MKRPNLPHLELRLSNLKPFKQQEETKSPTVSPTTLNSHTKPSLIRRTSTLKRKLSERIRSPIVSQTSTSTPVLVRRNSFSPELEQVQEEGIQPIDQMAPSRESEWPTARSIIRSLSNRQYLPRRSHSLNISGGRSFASSKLARSIRRFNRRQASADCLSGEGEYSKAKISKPMPWLPPLSFQRRRSTSFSRSINSCHCRSNSEPQIYFTPLEALTSNQLDDLEPWLGVLVAKPQSGEVDFGLPGPRRRRTKKARQSRASIACGDETRQSALTIGSVYSRASGDEEMFLSSTSLVQTREVTSPSPSPTTEEPNHRPSVPVDVDITVRSISAVRPAIPAYVTEDEDEGMDEDEDPFVYERYYRPSPTKSDRSTRSGTTGTDTPPSTRCHSPITPKSSFNHSFITTPTTPTTPLRYRPPSPFPFKPTPLIIPASNLSSREDLSSSASSSKASHGHTLFPQEILKESYNVLPNLPAFSISISAQTSSPTAPPATLRSSLSHQSPPSRPARRRPVGPIASSHRRGHTHDGHTSTIKPRERLKSLRRIASASSSTSPIKAPPLLTRKLSYKGTAGAVNNSSSTSLPNAFIPISTSASTSTVSISTTGRWFNNGDCEKATALPEDAISVESLGGTIGHQSEAHSVRTVASEVGTEGKKVVQIRWGYI